jgi:aryl sulfotransferase
MSVIWLNSYPKSGNTWVRFMIANMLAGPLETTELLQSIVPDIHDPQSVLERRRWQSQERKVAKSHLSYRDAEPFRGATGGFIYIVRNPLDVLASSLNFRLLTRPGQARASEADPERARREYVDAFLGAGGDPVWISVGFGSWLEHVRSWQGAIRRYRSLQFRYEDLLADPLKAGLAIREFLMLELDDAGVREAVEASGFERMREIERREVAERRGGFFGSRHRGNGVWFMNRGSSGGGKAVLTAGEVERAEAVFGDLMEELGYPVGRRAEGEA